MNYLELMTIIMDSELELNASYAEVIKAKSNILAVSNESNLYYTIANEKVIEKIKEYAHKVWEWIKKIFAAILRFIDTIFTKIKNIFSKKSKEANNNNNNRSKDDNSNMYYIDIWGITNFLRKYCLDISYASLALYNVYEDNNLLSLIKQMSIDKEHYKENEEKYKNIPNSLKKKLNDENADFIYDMNKAILEDLTFVEIRKNNYKKELNNFYKDVSSNIEKHKIEINQKIRFFKERMEGRLNDRDLNLTLDEVNLIKSIITILLANARKRGLLFANISVEVLKLLPAEGYKTEEEAQKALDNFRNNFNEKAKMLIEE